jgi:streptogramin lyase
MRAVIPRVALASALGALALGCSDDAQDGSSRISARIDVPGHPFRIAAGARFMWVLSRGATGACAPRRCSVLRIDPKTNSVVGRPIRLPVDGWDLTVGEGSVWVTQFDGRLLRIDARTARIRARIDARPLYFGSVVTFGDGFVWTGNDDERNSQGTVARLDPAGNRVVGNPIVVARPSSPQSIVFGGRALWIADHAGWLVKVDPTRFRVVTRRRLAFGPHGVAATERAVFVADAHGNRLLRADPRTAKISRIAKLAPRTDLPGGRRRLDLVEFCGRLGRADGRTR